MGIMIGEEADKAERQWKQRLKEGRRAKDEMHGKEEPRVKLLGFQGKGEPLSLGPDPPWADIAIDPL